MDPKVLRDLIELISESNVESFEYEQGDVKVKLVKESKHAPVQTVIAQPAQMPVATEAVATPPPTQAPAAQQPAAAPVASPAEDDDLVELRSPIVGTFYRAASPDAPDFVKVGARVSKGQVLCIVEAMKVMNEIESEIDAEVVEVLVANAQPVEFGEVLFKLRPVG